MNQEVIFKRKWRPLGRSAMTKMQDILDSWRETKYLALQCKKRVGVDCIRFVCSVADELYGYSRGPIISLPPDQSMHDRAGAFAAMRLIRRRYAPVDNVIDDEFIEPGDIFVCGPLNGGPGHAMIVGPAPGHIWETTMDGVQQSGMPAFGKELELFRIYRVRDKHLWL